MKKTLRIVSLALVSIMLIFVLASCGMGTYEKRLEKAGYEVEVADDEDIEKLNENLEDYEIKAFLEARKTELNSLTFEHVTIIKFASKKQATEYVDNNSQILTNVEQKGATIIFGTEDAVDVALNK